MDHCVFCKIVAGELPSNQIHASDRLLAFTPLANLAPVHALVIPRQHVDSLADVADLDAETRAEMPVFVAEVARMLGVEESGYRVSTNVGADALQAVFHLHWHILGGGQLSESM